MRKGTNGITLQGIGGMATGIFNLYYKDGLGHKVQCSDVRYRITRVSDGAEVVNGVTDEKGRTAGVSPDISQAHTSLRSFDHWATERIAKTRRASPLVPLDIVRYHLQVWSAVLKDWVDPELDITQTNRYMDVERDRETVATNDAGSLPAISIVVKELRLVPAFNVLFRRKGGKPIANAPYIAYKVDKNGRQVVATDIDGRAIKGNTQENGTTGRIACVDKLVFHFSLPAPADVRKLTRRIAPMPPGTTPHMYVLEVKSVSAVSTPNEGTIGAVKGKISAPAILNAEAEELILLEPKVWEEFEALSGEIESTFAGVHIARSDLNTALQGRSAEDIKAAEEALGLAEDRVAKMLNQNFRKAVDLQEVITFETYDKGRTTGNGGLGDRIGLRRRYVPRAKYEELKRRRIKNVPYKVELKASTTAKAGPASAGSKATAKTKTGPTGDGGDAVREPLSKKNFDGDAFVKSLRKITTQAKMEVAAWKTDPLVIDMIDVGGNEFCSAVEHSKSFSTETQAQWLRCLAGAGASGQFNWDPSKGRVGGSLQGSAQAKLVLFEGRFVASYAVPSSKGWQMHFAGQDLGAIVFVVACELYGFVGAKASVTGSVGVSVQSNKAVIKPLARDRNDSLADNYDKRTGLPRATLDNSRVVPGGLNEKAPKENEINGMKVHAEAFAGAEGGLSPSGELKWLPPEQRQPVSFAKLTVDVAVSLGAGASGQLYIYYASGKFRIKASARLCWGAGAKGALDFVVDAGGVLEFVKWVYYQLAHAGFKVLMYIAEDAFDVLSQFLYMAIIEGLGLRGTAVDDLLSQSVVTVGAAFRAANLSLERAEKRNAMAVNINRKPAWLIYATPETRGMLLYQLTRHDWASHKQDMPFANIGWADIQLHYMDQHKDAVINVFKCVRTVAEWNNVLQHMTPDGRKARTAGKAEGDVLRFLNYGKWLTDDLDGDVFEVLNNRGKLKSVGNRYIEEYAAHRHRLLGNYPKGYEVATLDGMDSTMLAQIDGQDSTMFAMMGPEASWLHADQHRIMLAMLEGAEANDDSRMA